MSCILGVEQDCNECRMCKKKISNADRIRCMTNSELAEIIMCPYEIEEGMCSNDMDCISCCKEWLESEMEE